MSCFVTTVKEGRAIRQARFYRSENQPLSNGSNLPPVHVMRDFGQFLVKKAFHLCFVSCNKTEYNRT